jgi:septal ring factor EnvC (AmiA/AmiB activator)
MSRLRERPRLVAARVLAVALVLVIGVFIGGLADDRNDIQLTAAATTQLQRAAVLSDQQADRLEQTNAELERVRADREDELARSRRLARANSRLRRELRDTKRSLRRTQRARRSRSR